MDKRPSDVIVAGISQTPVGEFWDQSIRQLGIEAILDARKDAGGLVPEVLYVGNLLAVSASRQANLGTLLAENAGLRGIEGSLWKQPTLQAGQPCGWLTWLCAQAL